MSISERVSSDYSKVNLEGLTLEEQYETIICFFHYRTNIFNRDYDNYKRNTKANIKHELELLKNNSMSYRDEYNKKYEGNFVYRMVDILGNIIYVGKTFKLVNRMNKEHFTSVGHLDSECYNRVVKVEIIKLKTEADMGVAENYFINKYKPEYNKKDKWLGNLSFSIPELDNMEWVEFEFYNNSKAAKYDREYNRKREEIKSTPIMSEKEYYGIWKKTHPHEDYSWFEQYYIDNTEYYETEDDMIEYEKQDIMDKVKDIGLDKYEKYYI